MRLLQLFPTLAKKPKAHAFASNHTEGGRAGPGTQLGITPTPVLFVSYTAGAKRRAFLVSS